jgi:ATP-dependent DNA helicase RecQ
MGIPAAALNSTATPARQVRVMSEAREGRYRLLYLSPERLARGETIGWLGHVPVPCFVIDEAHCISEWGHEFRPEYRQLSRLRDLFPDRPIGAFTASATRRVRHDMIDQLRLRDPHKYIASFHRPNLRYVVKQCDGQTQPALLLRALRAYGEGNVIVYAPTIKRVESTVESLEEKGIPAIGYHGRMDAETRRRNQERWMADEVRVLVGTIAFGLGINKAAVRAVIHLSLPKSLEQYYQEAGRAGRDGLPADCLLLWQRRDVGLLTHFILQIQDPAEKERAWERYHTILRFVETKACRHRQICTHFGETPKWATCEACDVCGVEPEWLSSREPSEPPPARRRRSSPVRNGGAARRSRSPETAREGIAAEVDPELRDYLREWRRAAAKEQGVPAYIVMHDTSLDELCRLQPRSLAELLDVSGFGQRKTERYGESILDALRRFRAGERTAPETKRKSKPRRKPK